jgi:hypothetical protein
MTITEKIVIAHFTINFLLVLISWLKDGDMDKPLFLFIIMMGWVILIFSIF